MEILAEGLVLASIALFTAIWGFRSVRLKEIKYGQPVNYVTQEPTRKESELLNELKGGYVRYNNHRAERRSTVKIVIPSSVTILFTGVVAALVCFFMLKHFHQHGVAELLIGLENYGEDEWHSGMDRAAVLFSGIAVAYGLLVGKIAYTTIRIKTHMAARDRIEKGRTVVIRQSASIFYLIHRTVWALFIEIPAQIIASIAKKVARFKSKATKRQHVATKAA